MKDVKKKYSIRKSILPWILSLSLLLSSCSSRLKSEKPIIPQVSVKNSLTKTIERVQTYAEGASDYAILYKQGIENSLEERDYLNYPEQNLIFYNLMDYSYLTRDKRVNFERQEELEKFLKELNEDAFSEVFKGLDIVVAFEEGMKDMFSKNKPKKKQPKNYFPGFNEYSEVKFGFKPSIKQRKVNFRIPIELENVFYMDKAKIEPGTDRAKIRISKKLSEDLSALIRYEHSLNLFGYKGEGFEDKKREINASFSWQLGKNMILRLGGGYERNEIRGKTYKQEFVGINLLCLSR